MLDNAGDLWGNEIISTEDSIEANGEAANSGGWLANRMKGTQEITCNAS